MTTEPPTPPAHDEGVGPDGLARRMERDAATALADPAGITDGREEAAGPQAPRRTVTPKSPTRNVVEWIAVVVGAVVIAVVIRTVFLQTFWIPSPSMSPTLVRDDRVLVNKLSYRLHDVHRGDVVVFERPPSEPPSAIKDLIKRVIALPGERISIVDGEVRIDGRILEEPYVHGLQTTYDGSCSSVAMDGLDTEAGFEVPEGNLFVMGDNRVNSHDGRCFGPIDQDLVVGRAFFILWPPSHAGGL